MNEVPNKSYTITSPSWDGSLNTKFVDVISPTTSFSGTDIVVAFAFDDSRAVTVGTLATMTYSLYREKRQVRTLGRISPRGVTKGPMTVAGTLIFSVINQHIVNDLRQEIYRINPAHPLCATGLKRIRMDELPPFDIILTFGNEYGQSAKMVIYGVTVTDEAMTFSIEDMFTENVMTYMARDIETMRGPFSNDMSMYIQGGNAIGGGTQLPKYGFSSDNLWNKTLDSYQQQVKSIVDKANRDYGDSYNAPDYSGYINLALGSSTRDDTVSYEDIKHNPLCTVHLSVQDEDGNTLAGIEVQMDIGTACKPGTSNSNGVVIWDNTPTGTTVYFSTTELGYETVGSSSLALPTTAEGGLLSAILKIKKLNEGTPGTADLWVTVSNSETKKPVKGLRFSCVGTTNGHKDYVDTDKDGVVKFHKLPTGDTYKIAPHQEIFGITLGHKYKIVTDPSPVDLSNSWAGSTRKVLMTVK